LPRCAYAAKGQVVSHYVAQWRGDTADLQRGSYHLDAVDLPARSGGDARVAAADMVVPWRR